MRPFEWHGVNMADRHDDEARQAPDPKKKEDEWQARLWAFAIVGGACVCFAIWLYVFGGETTEVISQRMTIMVPIGTLYIAAVTFLITYWRGLITTRQADQQREQIRALTDQVRLTDENNLANLLQRGAEMVADEGNAPSISAGIATLYAVTTAKNSRFAIPAMDVLAQFVESTSSRGLFSWPVSAAVDALADAHARNGLVSTRTITCETTETGSEIRGHWRTLAGVRFVVFRGGIAVGTAFGRGNPSAAAHFDSVAIRRWRDLDASWMNFGNCTFFDCRVRAADVHTMAVNTFENCDFSGARIAVRLPALEVAIRGNGNFYDEQDPPIIAWETVKPGDESPFWSQLQPRQSS